MRLILSATTALAALALPAHAQRLDDRVVKVETTPTGVQCVGSANSGLQLQHAADGSKPHAKLYQKPVTPDPVLDVAFGMGFSPREGTRFGVGSYVFGGRVQPGNPPLDLEIRGGRLILDGTDSGATFDVGPSAMHPGVTYLTVPEAQRMALGERVLAARWVDFELLDADGKALRRYRFDGLRIRDQAEILALITFSCMGARAD